MFLRSKPNKDHSEGLFIVKHAPKKLLEFKGNQGVVQTLNSYIESKNIPNLIITGPHGTGKSLLVKLLIDEYLGGGGAGTRRDYLNKGLLEIYGSLSRGKDVVSEKQSVKNKQKNFNCTNITDFMKRATDLPRGLLKIVVIYEFHQMSTEAQMALRRVMELNSHKVRFIFVTQDYSQIILALQSRCTILKLNRLNRDELDHLLREICQVENDEIDRKNEETDQKIKFSPELSELIYLNSEGDIRISVNLLQLLGRTDPDKYYSILGMPEIQTIERIINSCRNKKGFEAYQEVRRLMNSGYDISDLLDILTRVLISLPPFPEKNAFIRSLCHDTFIIQECYTDVQLYNLINHLIKIGLDLNLKN